MNENKLKNSNNEPQEKITFKDMVALAIAQLMIIGPIVVALVVGSYLLVLFTTKVWMK